MIEIDTHKPVEVIDITSSIERVLQQSKIEDGICLVYTPHTTTGLAINESDPDLVQSNERRRTPQQSWRGMRGAAARLTNSSKFICL
jgi:secondary thiamine-phosphate synthase enzyme